LEPYYVAALTAYRLEFLFRNQRLDSSYKAARYHIIMAMRYLMGEHKLPWMNSNDMRKLCEGMMETLWDQEKAEALVVDAANIVQKVVTMNGSPFDRDQIRTESTKDALLQYFGVAVPGAAS
jgi:hypothetical protein